MRRLSATRRSFRSRCTEFSLDELAAIMTGGDMTPPSVVTAHMALAHLRKEGML